MVERDRKRFAELLQALSTTLVNGRELSRAMLLGYWIALRDLSLEDFERGCEKALRTCRVMPSPAELLELAGVMSATMRAALAWDALKRALRTGGSWRSVDFDDPAINATVRNLGGWARLCGLQSEELDKWTRREFERLYAGFVDHGVPSDMGVYLAGGFEISNSASGFAVEPPMRITTGVPPAALLGPVSGPRAQHRLAVVEKVHALAKDKS
jgi:hypothetical protein